MPGWQGVSLESQYAREGLVNLLQPLRLRTQATCFASYIYFWQTAPTQNANTGCVIPCLLLILSATAAHDKLYQLP